MSRVRVAVWVLVSSLAAACGGEVSGNSSAGSGGAIAHTGGSGGLAAGGAGGYAAGGVGSTAGGGGVAATGTGGGGGYGNYAGAPPSDILGAACDTNSACDYMTCFDAVHPGGGAPHGTCTFECAKDPKQCSGISGASCAKLGGSAFCVAACTPGSGSSSAFDKSKCKGRSDMACAQLADGSYGCVPTCNGDFDCPNGTVCNPKTGLCQVGSVSGAGTGTACGDGTACKGECLEATQVCADRCTVGALPTCGWSGPGAGPAPAICFDPSAPMQTFGNLAHCTALCDCDGDCAAGSGCVPFADPAVASDTERAGYCAPGGPTTPCK